MISIATTTLKYIQGGGKWVLLGVMLLLISAIIPWFRVPYQWNAAGELELLTADAEIYYRCIAGVLGVIFLIIFIFLHAGHRLTGSLAMVGLVVMGSFPYAAMTLDPATGAQAFWFWLMDNNLTSSRGDLVMSLGVSETMLEEDVIIIDFPYGFHPIPSPQMFGKFGIGILLMCTQWLGYTPAFGTFVRWGWGLAILGTLLVAIGSVLAAPQPLRRLSQNIWAFGLALTLGIGTALIPIYMAMHDLNNAEISIANGRYAEAIFFLELAGHWVPLFAEDSYYVIQRGLLDVRIGQPETPSAQLYLAQINSGKTNAVDIRNRLRHLIEDPQITPAVRRLTAMALAREICLDFNSGLFTQAQPTLTAIAQVLPTDPKIEYIRQLLWLQQGNLTELHRSVWRMQQLYRETNGLSDAVTALGLARLARAELMFGSINLASTYAAMRGVMPENFPTQRSTQLDFTAMDNQLFGKLLKIIAWIFANFNIK